MNHKEILDLIALFEKSNLETMELTQGDFHLNLKKMTSSVPLLAAPQTASSTTEKSPELPVKETGHAVSSPMVGTFYRASNPEAQPFVNVGDTVKKGDVLCIIEAMKMLNEIRANVDGVITEILVENGDMVDYGKTLFIIEENYV